MSRIGLATAVAVGLRLVVADPAVAQEAAPPVPAHVTAAAPQVPIRMLADEGRAAMSRLRPTSPVAASPAKAAPASGGSETVVIEAPPGENRTSHFVFRDVTDRSSDAETTKTSLPLDVRRAAVEAVRQSLARDKGAPPR